jgi:DNA-binding response OmpR family regulator
MMSKVIYIVEDDDSIQDMLKIILERQGYEIKLYSLGKPVIKDNAPSPDMFLLDKQLPDIDGLDVCRTIKENKNTKKIPVVMISASPQIEELSKNAGADSFIEKPFAIKTLLNIVENFLPNPAAEHIPL